MDTGPVSEAGNWTNGLPSLGNVGEINSGSDATYADKDDFDWMRLNVTGDGQVTGGEVDINTSFINLFDNAVWTGTDLTLGVGLFEDHGALFTTYDNSSLNLTNLLVGGGTASWFRQYGGTVNISGGLTIGDSGKGTASRYDVLAGTLIYDGELAIGGNGLFNFPEDSTGTANLVNDVTTIDDVEDLINAGKITIGSSPVSPSQFSIKVVEIEGETYTEVKLVPEPSSVVLLLAFLGIVLIGGRLRRVWTR